MADLPRTPGSGEPPSTLSGKSAKFVEVLIRHAPRVSNYGQMGQVCSCGIDLRYKGKLGFYGGWVEHVAEVLNA